MTLCEDVLLSIEEGITSGLSATHKIIYYEHFVTPKSQYRLHNECERWKDPTQEK